LERVTLMPSSTLRIAMGGLKDDIWISDDPLRNGGGTSIGVTLWGVGETLTRVSRRGEVVPWLAESVRNLDPHTWHVRLRPNATFWDGTPVSPAAVAASFANSRAVQKDVALLLSGDIQTREVDPGTLEFRTEQPIGHFAAALAHPQMIVHRGDGHSLTGKYRPVAYEPDRGLMLEAFADHWSGRPLVSRVKIEVIPDVDRRMAALASDEVDLIYAFPPENVDALDVLRRSYEVVSWPSMRMHSIQLNCLRPPFDDLAVRQATSLAIDRHALIRDVLHGHGAATNTLAPPWSNDWSGEPAAADARAAAQLLDSAGWRMGPDGVRAKGEQRLAFTLFTPTGPVLAMRALAHAIAAQLALLGYAIRPQEVPALSGAVKDGAYVAALRTGYSQLTGDPYFWLKLWLSKDGRANPGPSYANPDLDRLLVDYGRETQGPPREEFRNRVDTLLTTDVPHVLLMFMPLILVARKGILPADFVGDPNSEYFVDGLSLACNP
jgi:peptide/nickel transport system substrate-binding protein